MNLTRVSNDSSKSGWTSVLDINAFIFGLIFLFHEPDPGDPLNRDAAQLFHNDKAQVRQFIY